MQVNGGNMTSLTGYIEKNYYYNLTLPTTAPAGLSLIGNLSVSPKFTGGSGTLQQIYTPASGSPLLNGGIVIPGITDGYTGSAPNIGAY